MRSVLGVSFWLAHLALSAGVSATPLSAQGATGKLQGWVQDELGRPLATAQIFVVGTAFGATTNNEGRYFINNVPAGAWTVRAIGLGHAPLEFGTSASSRGRHSPSPSPCPRPPSSSMISR